MMGRLIDVDALLEAMQRTEKEYENAMSEPNWWSALRIIKAQPTAYGTEKVMEKLEVLLDLVSGTHMFVVRQAIAIVRKGGVE